MIPADGFYEYTSADDPRVRRKRRWLFEVASLPLFMIAGVWRASDTGEAFAMLTCAPGPDIQPYHQRQVVVLGRSEWSRWLDPTVAASTLLRPLPGGSLQVTRADAPLTPAAR